jgi:hypothetical protein
VGIALGMHFQTDEYKGQPFPAATFLDIGGTSPGLLSPQRMVRLFVKGKPAVEETRRKIADWKARGCRVVPHNEPNLADEWGCSPEEFADWAKAVGGYFPGLSPSGNWTEYLAAADRNGALAAADGIVAHAYGMSLEDLKSSISPVLAAARKHSLPVWVGETNFGAGNKVDNLQAWIDSAFRPFLEWLRSLTDVEIEAVCWFAHSWDQSPKLPTSVDARGTAIEGLMRQVLEVKGKMTWDRKALENMALSYAEKYDLDRVLLFRQIETESSWNPNAVSRSGAKGLMQLMDATAKDLMVTDPFDPFQNLDGGCRYMSWLLKKFDGSYEKALVAYNMGPGALDKVLAAHPNDWKSFITAEAWSYLAKIQPPKDEAPKPPAPAVDIETVLRDETWALANRWADAGYPWTSQGLKAIVALNKGER